ncbi:uncharacterized protein LOC129793768 [Lutzomyia longipalpis]|uniref:uncharacterized protein LOC129793768 n=1 Tax=Lutzomyia longipalpis TaxID=7200 RepID=UPI00248331BD|nr:uncharacterized protein LOC129793768 [Lutzomyia longipalpis]
MFSRISNKTLAKVAVYGAFGSISAVFYMRWSIERKIRGQEFYKEALNLLKQHKGAETVLGNPISESGFDLSDKTNKCNSNEAHFEVSVRGPKDRGTYFFWARREEPKPWEVYRAELELKSKPDQRLILVQSSES